MKIVLDACVLFPTVMREVLLAVAERGLYRPIWSDRLLEEWARAAAKHGPEAELLARGDIVRLGVQFPDALAPPAPGPAGRLWLPDPADIHVLAVAVDRSADAIMTLNAKDFPRNILSEEGLVRLDPDTYLTGLLATHEAAVADAVAAVHKEAERLSGQPWDLRKLMKKARLPRLGRALERLQGD